MLFVGYIFALNLLNGYWSIIEWFGKSQLIKINSPSLSSRLYKSRLEVEIKFLPLDGTDHNFTTKVHGQCHLSAKTKTESPPLYTTEF